MGLVQEEKIFIFREKLVDCMTMLIVSVLVGVACKEEQAEPKFVTLAQEVSKTGGELAGNFLISRVHDKEWKIFYGFADNNYCNGTFKEEIESIKAKVKESIAVWLAPLRGKHSIIELSSIALQEKNTQPSYSSEMIAQFKQHGMDVTQEVTIDTDEEAPHLSIIFRCKEGRSFARVGSGTPQIHIYQNNIYSPIKAATKLLKYRSDAILHEMGHTFGLGDTYVEDQKAIRRFNQSTGGHSDTVGMQALSVMNSSFRTAVNAEGKLQLTPDDVAGIKWLYRYYVEKSIDICDCPYEYVYEEETGGCRPKYPLIFAAKQGVDLDLNFFYESYSVMQEEYFTHDDLAKVFAAAMQEQDGHGNTILHYYAANLAHREQLYVDRYVEISLTDKDILNIKNKLGKTAADIYASPNHMSLLYSSESLAAAKRKHQREAAKMCESIELKLAVQDGDVDKVKRLLASSHIDVNKQYDNYWSNTMLHAAVSLVWRGGEYVDIVALLLAHKDINLLIKNMFDETAFMQIRMHYGEDILMKCMRSFIRTSDFDAGMAYFNRIGPWPPPPEGITAPPPSEPDSNTDPATVDRPPSPEPDPNTDPPVVIGFDITNWCSVVELFHNTRGG